MNPDIKMYLYYPIITWIIDFDFLIEIRFQSLTIIDFLIEIRF